MKFVRGRASSQVIRRGVLGSLAVIFALEAFRENSWAKWRKNPVFLDCLPLPPPLGCSEHSRSREVMVGPETDFAWLTFISVFPSFFYVISCVLTSVDHDMKSAALEELLSKRSQTFLILASAVLNLLTLIISSFRISVLTALTKRQSFFQFAGLSAVYSTSYYLVMAATACGVLAVIIGQHLGGGGSRKSQRMAKTVKQHMARNLMYPDDKRSSKMVTFSSMDREMEEAAAEIAVRAIMQYGLEEDIAEHVKQSFESRFGPTWHCAVGTEFGSAVHHRTNEYIEVAMPHLSVLLFRCDQPSGATNTYATLFDSGNSSF